MKILVAHEGSEAGDAAIDDLTRAGLPTEGEAVVLSVADVWPPSAEAPGPSVIKAMPYVEASHARAKKLLLQAERVARQGADRFRRLFPSWRVSADAVADSPAWAIFKKARAWGADTVVVGSRRRSALARWTLGSVSQKVLAECPQTVRIARARPRVDDVPVKVLLAVDGSVDAERAAARVLSRSWPAQTRVRVFAVADGRLVEAPLRRPALGRWTLPSDKDPRAWIGRMVESVERRVMEKGWVASGRVADGDARSEIVGQARRWEADVVFLGARGLSRWERVFVGSVSSAVAAQAACSVEVVR